MRRARSRRPAAFLLALFVAAIAVVWPVTGPAEAAVPARAPQGLCTTAEWQAHFKSCLSRLADVGGDRVQCLNPPTPSTPDSGLAGWFAAQPELDRNNAIAGLYSQYGYAGYSYTTYQIEEGCASSLMHPDYKFGNTVANGEFMFATAVIGASNALREKAWDPKSMWGWADPLVETATTAIYKKVFSVFGVITLAIVGLYLLWRSRQSDMSNAMTTAGWAILVMVAVTALATWPVRSANIADSTLVGTLSVVHDAVGPQADKPGPGRCLDPNRCEERHGHDHDALQQLAAGHAGQRHQRDGEEVRRSALQR
jgi:hypothetical protein